jgi:hypothetical protein
MPGETRICVNLLDWDFGAIFAVKPPDGHGGYGFMHSIRLYFHGLMNKELERDGTA